MTPFSRSSVTPRSIAMAPFERPYPISYLPSIDTFGLSCTVFKIIEIFVNMGNPYSGPKLGGFRGFRSPYLTFFYRFNPQKAHVLSDPRLLSHFACKSDAPFGLCVNSRKNNNKSHTTSQLHPCAGAPPLVRFSPNLAVLVYGRT